MLLHIKQSVSNALKWLLRGASNEEYHGLLSKWHWVSVNDIQYMWKTQFGAIRIDRCCSVMFGLCYCDHSVCHVEHNKIRRIDPQFYTHTHEMNACRQKRFVIKEQKTIKKHLSFSLAIGSIYNNYLSYNALERVISVGLSLFPRICYYRHHCSETMRESCGSNQRLLIIIYRWYENHIIINTHFILLRIQCEYRIMMNWKILHESN